MGMLSFLDGGGDDKAQQLLAQQMQEAKNLPLPILKEYYPKLYKIVAQMNPELETAVNLGPSEMQGISTDPGLRQAQLNALAKLQDVGAAGGRDSQFLANQAQLESDVNTNTQGQQGAIMQNLATRGMGGGGQEMVARQLAAQGGANRQAQMGMDAKAQADQRALSAIMQSGQLGGQMQAQDFSQASQKAQAADAISRFNAQNQQNVIGQNVGARNQAQQFNAVNANETAARNTSGANQAQQQNLSLAQQQYENELKKRGLISGAAGNLAGSYQQEAAGNRAIIGGAISAGSMYASGGAKK